MNIYTPKTLSFICLNLWTILDKFRYKKKRNQELNGRKTPNPHRGFHAYSESTESTSDRGVSTLVIDKSSPL